MIPSFNLKKSLPILFVGAYNASDKSHPSQLFLRTVFKQHDKLAKHISRNMRDDLQKHIEGHRLLKVLKEHLKPQPEFSRCNPSIS